MCAQGCQWADGRKWAEIGKSAKFLHLRVSLPGRNAGGNGRKRFSLARIHAKGYLHAREALRTPFPLSQSG